MLVREAYPSSDAVYDGEYYDSQTEAAWAAFFDRIDLKFIHEPQTYKLPSGVIYTPDFYLPEFQTHIEIKNGNLGNEPAYKMSLLTFTTSKPGFICNGMPHYASIYGYTPEWTFEMSSNGFTPYDTKQHPSRNPYEDPNKSWMPDYKVDHEQWAWFRKAAKLADIAISTTVPEELRTAHAEKKKQLRSDEYIVDLSRTPMPPGSYHVFSRYDNNYLWT